MEPNCILHEERLKSIEESLGVLLERNGDFYVKVINGKTERRLASELIGELYVTMQQIKKETPRGLANNIVVFAEKVIPILTLFGLIITMFKVFGQ